jgi:hypothetical protein
MLRIVEETVRSVTPHVLGIEGVEGMPPSDPEDAVSFLGEWLDRSIPEYGTLNTAVFLLLNLYSLVRKGRTFPRLDTEAQARLMEGIFKTRGLIALEFQLLLSTPAVSSYYARVDVQEALGFDITALREEAKEREVTRDGGPLPPKEDAAASETGAGEDSK